MKRLVLNLGQKELKRARHRCLRRCCLVATCVSSPPELLAQLAVAVHKTCSSSSSSLLLSARPSRSGRVVIEAGTAHHRAGGAVPRRQIRCREAALDTGKQSNTTFQPAPVPHHHPLPPPPPPPPPPPAAPPPAAPPQSIWVLQSDNFCLQIFVTLSISNLDQ